MTHLLLAIVTSSSGTSIGRAAAAEPYECGTSRIGWALPAEDGDIRTLYWATTNATELYFKFTPQQPHSGEAGVPRLLFVFSICFAGRVQPASSPSSAELRVQVLRNFAAALVPDPSVSIMVDKDRQYDLTGPGFKHWTEYPPGCAAGDGCAYSAVLVELPIEILRVIGAGGTAHVTISGVPFALTAEQRRWLTVFLSRITGG